MIKSREFILRVGVDLLFIQLQTKLPPERIQLRHLRPSRHMNPKSNLPTADFVDLVQKAEPEAYLRVVAALERMELHRFVVPVELMLAVSSEDPEQLFGHLSLTK